MKPLTGVGIWSGGLRGHPDDGAIREAAAELEEIGFSSLFIPGGVAGVDIFPALDRLLDSTRAVPVVSGILSIWLHDSGTVLEYAREAELRHPGRFIAGIGVSHQPSVDYKVAGRYTRPYSKMVGYLDELDAGSPPIPASRRLIAALAPRMLKLSAERAIGAHPYFMPVAHTPFARAQIGPAAMLAVEQTVVFESDPAVARAHAREFMAVYLALPNYCKPLFELGFSEADVADGGSDRLVDAIVAWGDDEAVAARIAAQLEAGADHVCVQVIGPEGGGLPLAEWRRLAAVVG